MSCKKFECEDRNDNVCCFDCFDFAECGFPCDHAFTKNFTRENYKSNCEYFKSDEIWSWNETDDESWSHGTFDSREEAIEDALGNIEEIKSYLETDTPTIYLGRCEYVPLPTSVDSERILFDLDEQYCSETGCENYIYEGVTDEQTKWLEDKLSDLMFEFHKMIGLKSCWFTVVEQEEVNLCEYKRRRSK